MTSYYFDPEDAIVDGRIRDGFYSAVVQQMLAMEHIDTSMSVLVVCGGMRDRDALYGAGFTNVTISNLDSRLMGTEFEPYAWSFQDVEELNFEDSSFDLVIVANGLHHCASPHRGLLEMYRVAKHAVLAFEPRSSLLVRLGVRLGFGQEYEVAAVHGNDCAYGGVKNTEIPNYVYRWTEREIEQTIQSYAPWTRHQIEYVYGLRVPWDRLQQLRNGLYVRLTQLGMPILKLLTKAMPKQSNAFAFLILKPDLQDGSSVELLPWLTIRNGRPALEHDWVRSRYS